MFFRYARERSGGAAEPGMRGGLYTIGPSAAAHLAHRGTNRSGAIPHGRQNPASQNGTEQATTGSEASEGATPAARLSAAATATDAASPLETHASVLALSFPTIFSWYSEMSLWTATLSTGAPHAGSQLVSSIPK